MPILPSNNVDMPNRGSFVAGRGENIAAARSAQDEEAHQQQIARDQIIASATPRTSLGHLFCDYCDYRFANVSGFNYHKDKQVCKKQSYSWRFRCENCGQKFSTEERKEDHFMVGLCLDDNIAPTTPIPNVAAAHVIQPTYKITKPDSRTPNTVLPVPSLTQHLLETQRGQPLPKKIGDGRRADNSRIDVNDWLSINQEMLSDKTALNTTPFHSKIDRSFPWTAKGKKVAGNTEPEFNIDFNIDTNIKLDTEWDDLVIDWNPPGTKENKSDEITYSSNSDNGLDRISVVDEDDSDSDYEVQPGKKGRNAKTQPKAKKRVKRR